jgi:hypothetical protein
MTTAGSSSVPFLEMVFPFLLVTSALPALMSATVPAKNQLIVFVPQVAEKRHGGEEGEIGDMKGEEARGEGGRTRLS